MKKLIFFLFILIISIFIILIYPRKITHALFIESSPTHSVIYIKGQQKEIKAPNLNLEKYTVFNFRYNILGIHSIQEVSPVRSRIMAKKNNIYELEAIGDTKIYSNASFYKIDENNNLSISSAKDIIVGKSNMVSFIDKNKLKTFIIYPMDYSSTRVGISTENFQSIYHNNLTIKFSSSSKLYSLVDKFSLDVPENSQIEFTANKSNLRIITEAGTKVFKNRIYLAGGPFTIKTIKRGYPSFSPAYNGILELYPTNDGIIVINDINIEDYLTKVVPSEMPVWGGIEALKCQAVAARTYAISDMLSNRYANLGFYVDDSTKSQVYNNLEAHPLSNQAIKETSGLIMTFNNNPIDAKYYSTSCGTGVNYEDIWFNSDGSSDYKPYLKTSNYLEYEPPLPSSEEQWLNFYKDTTIKTFDNKSPYFRWKISYSEDLLKENLSINLKKIYDSSPEYITLFNISNTKKKLKGFPKTLGNLKDIQVLQRSEGGNLLEISFIFDNAVVNIKKDSYIRRAFSNSSKIEKTPLIRYNGTPLENWTTLPSSFFSVEGKNNVFTIYGGGYGHGVGMSQYGAIYLGQNGIDFHYILKLYYNSINIKKIY